MSEKNNKDQRHTVVIPLTKQEWEAECKRLRVLQLSESIISHKQAGKPIPAWVASEYLVLKQ